MVYRQSILVNYKRVQNSAARIICKTSIFDHITPVLCTLHWLHIKFRIRYKILIPTFKAIHGLAPEYITNLISIKEKSTYSLRSNRGLLLNQPNAKLRKTLGGRLHRLLQHFGTSYRYIFETQIILQVLRIYILKTHFFKTTFNV